MAVYAEVTWVGCDGAEHLDTPVESVKSGKVVLEVCWTGQKGDLFGKLSVPPESKSKKKFSEHRPV